MSITVEKFISRFPRTFFSHAILPCLLGLASMPFCLSAYARPEACLDSVRIEPGFIAFNSITDSELGDWYRNLFGMEIVKEFAFADGLTTGVLMQRGEFIVEVFYRPDLLQTSDITHGPDSAKTIGVMKVGIFTDANLVLLQQCLKEQGVNAGRIFADEKLGIDLLQVTDPEQNTLEIISRVIQ